METNQPFGKPLHLGEGHYAIYANCPFIRGEYNTPLLFKGTELECRRQYKNWIQNPDQFDRDMFNHRQNRKAA